MITRMLAPRELRRLERAVGTAGVVAGRCGVEHEYTVLADGRTVDFRGLIHTLDIPGRRLDPADRNAYRCGWGGAITADGREAEIATPPMPLERGFAAAVVHSAARGRACLDGVLPVGTQLRGYSTHINVSVPDGRVVAAARTFASRFAVALMLLMDDRTSPGLLVRPRRGRLELGGEYIDGDGLRAAVVMATGAALASASRLPHRPLPRALVTKVVPTVERFGLYVDRRAFGPDLYEFGRAAVLTTTAGVRRTAQQELEQCWDSARRAARKYVDATDLTLVDDYVAGRRPLPCETTGTSDGS